MCETLVVIGVVGIVAAFLLGRASAIERLVCRASRVEAKVDMLLRHAGLSFDPVEALPAEVREALQAGHTLRAIRQLRRATGASLREAKDVIEEASRRLRSSR